MSETKIMVRCRTCGTLLELGYKDRHEKHRCEKCGQRFELDFEDGHVKRLKPILPTSRVNA